ncbi:MAG: alpha/beta fold hydrolase [Armatimonadota bacterium]|nr:alpha/beta fold hydrolase [Armatimonadota bacterium]MDR7451734.1 alpha/beta fold hydrolase [Armatimonadota bacterium]MDR7467359.1 alpha/beta fold hydrolase [Armatimonadota bacterium]MDR7494129.1 alpha/beta fold hydrolase [Armatimonadota bacterium]MDR7498905.1 alpha/beta fold hydrolase [Armatimonadota bacterium]
MPHGAIWQWSEGGPAGCLLLHGFSGSPLEMVPLAETLAEAGWTVAVARLAGHTSPTDLARATAEDWLASGKAAYEEVADRCNRVAVLGLSMGGAVGLVLGATVRPAAVVAISTPLRMKRLIARATRMAARVVPYVPVLMRLGPREQAMRRFRSPAQRIPLRAAVEVDRLLEVMRRALPRVRAPVLVAQGRRDWIIPRESAGEIAAATGGQVLWLPRSGHVATLDRDREMLFREVGAFLRVHLDR